jgi:hypothetical protein
MLPHPAHGVLMTRHASLVDGRPDGDGTLMPNGDHGVPRTRCAPCGSVS